jgi:hypothetical protein
MYWRKWMEKAFIKGYIIAKDAFMRLIGMK